MREGQGRAETGELKTEAREIGLRPMALLLNFAMAYGCLPFALARISVTKLKLVSL
jgi:hypothetical protein